MSKRSKRGKMADLVLRPGNFVGVGESASKKSYTVVLKNIFVLARLAVFF